MTNHTPLPWSTKNIFGTNQVVSDTGIVIAKTFNYLDSEIGFELAESNAKLIALSPKMYDFISRIVNTGSSMDLLDMIEEAQTLFDELE